MRLRGTISGRLLESLLEGRKRLGDKARKKVCDFVESQHAPGGGFMGKGGTDDVYYTIFGWMLEWTICGTLNARTMKAYIEHLEPSEYDLVHYAAYARCVMLQKLAESGPAGVLKYLLPGSGFLPEPSASVQNRVPGGDSSAPYSRFIRLSLEEDSGRKTLNKREILESLDDYRVTGGGYSNVRDATGATTTATAAAMTVKGQLTGYRSGEDSRFLCELQDITGGFSATPEAPVPDLLSTATALFTLIQYGEQPKYSAADFVEGHWLDTGGFAATLLDEESDVEYTFYGLLALGAL